MPGGGDTQTVQQKSDPWSGVQPYLQGQAAIPASNDITFSDGNPVLAGPLGRQQLTGPGIPGRPAIPGVLPEAARLYTDVNPSFFPGSTVAQFDPAQMQAQNLTMNRAMGGSDVLRSAQQNNLATTRGDYLYGGPGFNAAFQAASDRINPMVDSAFGGAGRLNSGLAQTAKTQALGNAFAGLYGDERQRQQQASVLAPGLANADYGDFQQLSNVGAERQGMNQANINEQIARHDFAQNLPFQKLSAYQGFLNPSLGLGGTTSSPVFSNTLGQILGTGLAGSQIYKNLGFGGGAAALGGSGALGGIGAGAFGAGAAGLGGISASDLLALGLL